jgi:hypothetical protein
MAVIFTDEEYDRIETGLARLAEEQARSAAALDHLEAAIKDLGNFARDILERLDAR